MEIDFETCSEKELWHYVAVNLKKRGIDTVLVGGAVVSVYTDGPPRLKDLVNEHVMGDVWVRDSPFGAVTDSLKIAKHFDMQHRNILRAIDKCNQELGTELKFELCKNIIENSYLSGPKGRQRKYRKVDISEFGLTLLLLYINSPKARKISAEILYRFFILKSYLEGLSEDQIGALKVTIERE